jgi:hypothetical protein
MFIATVEILSKSDIPRELSDRIDGLGEDYVVIKVRVKNSNIQKGKSAAIAMILVHQKSWIFCLPFLIMNRQYLKNRFPVSLFCSVMIDFI